MNGTKESPFKISTMSSQKTLPKVSPFHVVLYDALIVLFVIVSSCTSNGSATSFPPPNREVWCSYNVSFNEGTSSVDVEKEKETMRQLVLQNTRSTEDGIQCDPSANWVRVDDLHWQLQVTVNCFRLSDTSTVRPPSGTKPPPARVTNGTVEKSGCPEDEIKK